MVGTWKIEKLLIDNADSTDEYISKVGCEIEFLKDDYYPDGISFKLNLKNCINGKTCLGFWEFTKNNKTIYLNFIEDTTFQPTIGPIGESRFAGWVLAKLTNKEFKAETYSYWHWNNVWGPQRKFNLEMTKQ